MWDNKGEGTMALTRKGVARAPAAASEIACRGTEPLGHGHGTEPLLTASETATRPVHGVCQAQYVGVGDENRWDRH